MSAAPSCPTCGLVGGMWVTHTCLPPAPDEGWKPWPEPATPLYIGPLPDYTRRMLQALDAYWLHCDGLPKDRRPRSKATAEDWWARFEKYRALVEGQL